MLGLRAGSGERPPGLAVGAAVIAAGQRGTSTLIPSLSSAFASFTTRSPASSPVEFLSFVRSVGVRKERGEQRARSRAVLRESAPLRPPRSPS